MIEVKQSQRAWVPVRLFNASNGSGSVGVIFSDVTVLIVKSDTTEAAYTVSNGDWVEHTTAPATGSGIYQLNLKTTDTGLAGSLLYVVQSTLSRVHIGSIKVVANEEADTFALVTTVSGALNSVSGSLRTEILATRDIVSGSLINVSASLRTEILTTRDVLSGSLINVSASLRTEELSTRSILSASIVAVSSSLRSEIINNGGASVTAVLSASMVTLSSSLRSEILTTRDTLSSSMVTLSASLRTEELSTRSILSGALTSVSSSLWTEIASAQADVSSSLVAVSSSLGQQLTRLREGAEGRWKIFTTGPDANRMVFYRPDGTTVIYKVDLKDAAGLPTTNSPFERVPV